MAKAGYCAQCGTNVWLTAEGECPNGHGAEAVSNVYDTESTADSGAATPPGPAAVPTPQAAAVTQPQATASPSVAAPRVAPTGEKPKTAMWIAMASAALVVCGLLVAVGAFVLLRDGGDDSGSGSSGTGSSSPGSVSQSGKPLAAEEIAAYLEDRLAESEVADLVTGVEVVTKLGHPITEVWTSIAADDYGTRQTVADACYAILGSDALDYSASYYLEIVTVDGARSPSGGTYTDGWKLELPAPPTSADGVLSWLQDVYGGESWVGHIDRVVLETDTYGTTFLTAYTDLDYEDAEDKEAARLVSFGLGVAGSSFAEYYEVRFAQGGFQMSGDMWVGDPYAY